MNNMKPSVYLLILALFAGLTSCKEEEIFSELSREKQEELLDLKWEQLQQMIAAESCNTPENWGILPIGSRPCGGPATYLPYSVNMDVDLFNQRVDDYTSMQISYNQQWGIGSICSLAPVPKAIVCEEGVATLVY
jgi:hypothetical protein